MEKSQTDQLIIAGMGRSGTSLLRAILSSHSQVEFYEWELNFWTTIYPKYQGKPLTAKRISYILDDLFDSYALTRSQASFSREDFESHLGQHKDPLLRHVYDYIKSRYVAPDSKKLFSLKVPLIELEMEAIMKEYPNTRVVHLVRHPLANFRSMQEANKKWWGGKFGPMQHMYLYDKSLRKGRLNLKMWPERYMLIRYEDLVAAPEEMVKKICAFAGLEFEPSMMSMDKGVRWKGSNSSVHSEAQSHRGIYSQSMDEILNSVPESTRVLYSATIMSRIEELYPEPAPLANLPASIKFKFQRAYLQLKDSVKNTIRKSDTYEQYSHRKK